MILDSLLRFRPAMLALTALFLGCAATNDPSDDDIETEAGGTEAPIIGGSKATGYAEAALIDMGYGNQSASACSGALIAPRVVLTAGHCIGDFTSWKVTLPFAGNISAKGKGIVYDYDSSSNYVEPNQHDVGLIILDSPLNIQSYPKVATAKVPDGTKIQNIGRINNGQFSNTALYISQPISVKDAKSSGFPYDYITDEVIQPGDSGGPVVLSGTHTIVAVNSGAGGGTEVLARVDLLYSWIKSTVDANGGGGTYVDPNGGGGGAGGAGGSGGSGGAGGSGGSGGAGGGGTGDNEQEPNNTYSQPNTLGPLMKGSLAASDQDWFTWSVGSEGVKYNLTLQASGNAQIQMWKLVNGQYYKTPQTSPTQIAQTSSGAGKYFVVVYSGTGASQNYSLTLQK